MHDPERDIRDIPLSQLELSPDNVRKTPADASAFTELKASIAAHGLLENLIARAMEPGPDGPGCYAVIAGGRRLAAMQALAAEGALDEDHPVPCRMIGAIVAAEEVSLAENSVRAAMHPADQVEAFRRLADAGSTAAAIATRFGVSERTVEKRLRLGNAAPVLLEAYRAGEIDLDTLMAFAVTTNQARQSAVWETVSQQGYRPSASRACLQSRQLHAHAGLATGDCALVADHAAGEADQDRRENDPPWPLRHVPDGRGRGVAANVRSDPGADCLTACAAGAGLIQAAVGGERKTTGDVCLDDKKSGHEHRETAIGANADREQSAPSPASASKLLSKAGMATLMVGCGGHPGNLGLALSPSERPFHDQARRGKGLTQVLGLG